MTISLANKETNKLVKRVPSEDYLDEENDDEEDPQFDIVNEEDEASEDNFNEH